MNYIIFDNDIYYEAKDKKGMVSKQEIGTIFDATPKDVSAIVIDTLQKQVPALEKGGFKRDEALACAFSGDYISQSEQIGHNLFQVIAIEKTKLNDIYKCLGFENVKLLIPYALALREFLKANNLILKEKRTIFLEHLGNQVLLTIFNNNVFTTPRRLSIMANRVVSELRRSQENYRSLNKDEKDLKFLIATNNKGIRDEIIRAGLEAEDNVVLTEEAYPSLAGLRIGKFFMHYMLPEQFIRLRRRKILKRRLMKLGIMAGILAVLLVIFLSELNINKNTQTELKRICFLEEYKIGKLRLAYAAKYKDIVRREKKIDFPNLIDSFINSINSDYKIESITVRNLGNVFRFEAILYLEAKDEPFIPITLPRAFKKAKLENILVKDNPGIKVVLDIL